MLNPRLPKILRTLRLWYGYTQSFVAKKLDMGQQAYSNYERGTRQPDAGALYTLAELYHISVESLLNPDAVVEEKAAYQAADRETIPQDPEGLMQFLEDPAVRERIQRLTRSEKELLFYYHSLSPVSRQELMEIARLKVRLESPHAEKSPQSRGKHRIE